MAVARPAVNGSHMAQRSQDKRSSRSLLVLAAALVAVIAVTVALAAHHPLHQQLAATITSLVPQVGAVFKSIQSLSPFGSPTKSPASEGTCSCQVSRTHREPGLCGTVWYPQTYRCSLSWYERRHQHVRVEVQEL